MKTQSVVMLAMIPVCVVVCSLLLLDAWPLWDTRADAQMVGRLNPIAKQHVSQPASELYQEFLTPFSASIADRMDRAPQADVITAFIENTGKKQFWSYGKSVYQQHREALSTREKFPYVESTDSPEGYAQMWGTPVYVDTDGNEYRFLTEIASGNDVLFFADKQLALGMVVHRADSGIQDVGFVNNLLTFRYRKSTLTQDDAAALQDCYERYASVGAVQSRCGEKEFDWEYFYGEPNISETLEVDALQTIFEYGGKVGFVGRKDGEWAVYYDGQIVSAGFDEIRTIACCALQSFPFEVYENGVVFFMGRRGQQYFLAEVRLPTEVKQT